MTALREYVNDRLARYPGAMCALHHDLRHWLMEHPDRPSNLALSPQMESEREALLDLLRTEVPSYVDSPSAMWGAAHVLLIARRETPAPGPVTVTRERVAAAMYRARADAALAALGITVTEEGDDRG